jgi:hypothetical protein
VDREFGPEPLRVVGRVIEMTRNLKDPRLTDVKIGYTRKSFVSSIGDAIASVTVSVEEVRSSVASTSEFLTNLIDNLNAQINATGGYFYVTRGQGVRTYDKAVSDPLVGAEADAVVEMKGGTLRFANTRTAQGEFDWRTVLTADGINGDLVTALNAMFGTIRNQTGSIFISLDTGEFSFPGMRYDSAAGALIFGFDPETGQPDIKNRITATGQSYLINGAEVSSYGVDVDGISKMWLGVASVRERLEFQDFAWIARANGNMTLKWMGA